MLGNVSKGSLTVYLQAFIGVLEPGRAHHTDTLHFLYGGFALIYHTRMNCIHLYTSYFHNSDQSYEHPWSPAYPYDHTGNVGTTLQVLCYEQYRIIPD